MISISVVIPVYNRAHYIGAAIDSLRAQRNAADFEIVVVDDGSTDDSRARVRAYTDARIRLVALERNRGIAAARNRGIEVARGSYVAFLDSDDLAMPDRLARQAAFLDAHPDYAAVGAWIGWIDDSGKRIRRIKRKPTGATQIAAERLFRSGLENSTVMARAAILREYAHREDLQVGSDYDLWARIAVQHKLATLPRQLVQRRVHSSQATALHAARDREYRCRIFAWQLDALGVRYTDDDLARHYQLRRLGKTGARLTSDDLVWVNRWLLTLQRANREKKLYPEPAFSGVLGVFWLSACWHAGNGWRRFWCSPLRTFALSGTGRAAMNRLSFGPDIS